MQRMKFFIDTHDRRSATFPAGLGKEQFADFFGKYEAVAREHGVVVLRVHVGLEEGRAYCFTMAPGVDQVRAVHQALGLPYEVITEVATATPGDLFFRPAM